MARHGAFALVALTLLWLAAGALGALAGGSPASAPPMSVVAVLGAVGAVVGAFYSMARPHVRVVQNQLASGGVPDAAGGSGLAIISAVLFRYAGPVLVAALAYLPFTFAERRGLAASRPAGVALVLVLYAALTLRVLLWPRRRIPFRAAMARLWHRG
ncbi:MAG: hypothetical protein ABR573_01305 [Candidatus Dormibacteria bacterium]